MPEAQGTTAGFDDPLGALEYEMVLLAQALGDLAIPKSQTIGEDFRRAFAASIGVKVDSLDDLGVPRPAA